jgi:ectoine hydroxylase-related dioxygenase (phytanoyl-CoA dioxygenase family)
MATTVPATVLSEEDIADFNEFGYLVLRNVLTREEAEHYRNVILGMIPADLTIPKPWTVKSGRIKPYHAGYGDQETRRGHEDNGIFDTPDLIPLLCHETPYRAAAELMGSRELRAQDGTIGITLRNDDGPTLTQNLHVDPSVPDTLDNFTFSPSELTVGGAFYLTDVEPHGGGMHVVPGGHRLVAEAARNDPQGRHMFGNWVDIKGFPEPVEVTGSAGDFIMTHYLLPHCASNNRNERARVAYFVRYARLDHPFYPPPAPSASRYNTLQRKALSPLGQQLVGLAPW